MAIELPDFDPDVSRVSGFTEPGHESGARLFLPLARSGTHRYIPWHVAAEQAGRALHALTTWDDLAHAADVGLAWEPPSGTIDDVTAQALVGALAQQLPDGAATSTRFALWEGHAGEIGAPLHDVITPVPASGQNFLCVPQDWTCWRSTPRRRCHPAEIDRAVTGVPWAAACRPRRRRRTSLEQVPRLDTPDRLLISPGH